ncbi:MAG TPA: hypothetical protein VG938_03895 [Verrucomicrobiae bacterium]|nr:hypothetical protein [Verrucomicrobiae bacterium]
MKICVRTGFLPGEARPKMLLCHFHLSFLPPFVGLFIAWLSNRKAEQNGAGCKYLQDPKKLGGSIFGEEEERELAKKLWYMAIKSA